MGSKYLTIRQLINIFARVFEERDILGKVILEYYNKENVSSSNVTSCTDVTLEDVTKRLDQYNKMSDNELMVEYHKLVEKKHKREGKK